MENQLNQQFKDDVLEIVYDAMALQEGAAKTTRDFSTICKEGLENRAYTKAMELILDEGEDGEPSAIIKYANSLAEVVEFLYLSGNLRDLQEILQSRGVTIGYEQINDTVIVEDILPPKKYKKFVNKFKYLFGEDESIPTSKTSFFKMLVERGKDAFMNFLISKEDIKNKEKVVAEKYEKNTTNISLAVSIASATRNGYSDKAVAKSDKISAKAEETIELAKVATSI